MRHLQTRSLEGFNGAQIDKPASFAVNVGERNLGYEEVIANTPAITSSYDGFNNPQQVISSPEGLPLWDETKHFPVGRLNGRHGRNIEVLADEVKIVDRFGNEYQSLGIKGGDLSDPHLMESETASRDYIIHGLQESLVMERIIRASGLLREQGVGTEYICGLVVPEVFPAGKKEQGVDMPETKTLPTLLEHLSTRYANELADKDDNDKTALELKAEMMDRFSDCDYLISYRAMDCPHRFVELSNDDNFEDFKAFLILNDGGQQIEEYLDNLHVYDYVIDDFAPALGDNLAKMHKLGLSHGFLHSGNITALGSIVDLDSCRGESLGLGDEAPDTKAELYDVFDCMENMGRLINTADSRYYSFPQATIDKQTSIHFASISFLHKYITERFDNPTAQTEFLVAMVSQRERDQERTQGYRLIRQAEQVSDIYVSLFEQTDPELNLPDSGAEIQFQRPNSFLSILPSRFFRDVREMVIENTLACGVELPPAIEAEGNNFHPLVGMIKSICIGQILDAYQSEDSEITPTQLMTIISNVIHLERSPDNPLSDEQKLELKSYFNRIKQSVLDVLCGDDQNVTHPILKEVFESELKDYSDKLGSLPTEKGEQTSSILYLDEDEQYLEVFEALGIDEKTEIIQIDMDNFGTIFEERRAESPDLLTIADYKSTEGIAFQPTATSAANSVLSSALYSKELGIRPLIFVTRLKSGKPEVLVLAIRNNIFPERSDIEDKEAPQTAISEKTLRYSYDELLKIVAPSTTEIEQTTLFTE